MASTGSLATTTIKLIKMDYTNRLIKMAAYIGPEVLTISNEIFQKIPAFSTQSGSAYPQHHHYGDGGLERHSWEVIEIMSTVKRTMNLDIPFGLIFVAGLFHDIGKVWDYKRVDNSNEPWVPTKHKREIHHISRSGLVWSKAVDSTGLFKEHHDDVLHAILAHHGQREWGSPVMPHTKLAWLLHLCDGISARMDDCGKEDQLKHKE